LRRERIAGVKIAQSETALINAIIEAISNPAIKAQLTTANPTPPLRRQIEIRRQLGQMLARSILAEWKDELEESPATSQQIDDATNYWLSMTKDSQKRAALQKRLQTEQGHNLVAAVAAIQFNPRFDNQRPIINWLFRGLSPGPLNRGAARRAAAANPPAAKMSDESDKEPATDQ
jgi:hypothetical protein